MKLFAGLCLVLPAVQSFLITGREGDDGRRKLDAEQPSLSSSNHRMRGQKRKRVLKVGPPTGPSKGKGGGKGYEDDYYVKGDDYYYDDYYVKGGDDYYYDDYYVKGGKGGHGHGDDYYVKGDDYYYDDDYYVKGGKGGHAADDYYVKGDDYYYGDDYYVKGGSSSKGGKGGSAPVPGNKGGGKGGSAPVPAPSNKGPAPAPAPSPAPVVGKGKGAPTDCPSFPIYFFKSEVIAAEYTNAIGFGLNTVPFYDADTGAQLGTYSDFATEIPSSDECLVDGAFSFDPAPDSELFRSTINVAFTCGSEANAIVGGTGRFGCASGYEVFQFEDEEILGTAIFLCDPLCPFRFKDDERRRN